MKKQVIAFLVVVRGGAHPAGPRRRRRAQRRVSLAKISESPAESLPWQNLPFFVGGLSFEASLGIISLQSEILYVRMGAKYTAEPTMASSCRTTTSKYRFFSRLNVLPAGPIRPFICGGGYGSYLIKAELALKTLGVVTKEDMTEERTRFDYGVVGGLGLAFKLPVISLSVEGRYNFGLMNIIKNPGAGEAIKNRCLMALVGIGF